MRTVWDEVGMPPEDKRDKSPDSGEVEWSRACDEVSAVDVRLDWGDGYTPRLQVGEETNFRIPVLDRTSEKLNRLPFQVAVFLVGLLAHRAGLTAEDIRFPKPAELVDRATLLEWVGAIRSGREGEALQAMAARAERLRLPWEESDGAG